VSAGRLPGFVNAHSHTFQRALRGRVEDGDFWSWRDQMIDFAGRLDGTELRKLYAQTYEEMTAAGYTAVGEFHYLGVDAARAAAEAAGAAGIAFVLLHVAYERGGIPRFRQASVVEYLEQVESLRAAGLEVGLAPHSVRACSRAWLSEIGTYARDHGLVLHVHADEQPREIEECVAEHGVRPIELLAQADCLGRHTTIVHATHADDAELDLIAGSGARVCLCPTTEANLGDGFMPVERLFDRGVDLCIGSDSNVRIDPFEELREIETTARRISGRRGVIAPEALLRFGGSSGARAIGLEVWPSIQLDLGHRALRGVGADDLAAALVFGCAGDVVAAVRNGEAS
jgi:formimidoylglutamate deiminase